ncbi:MAG TPA: caspase family protein, partial [Geminicoccaceae bacterium]|nr:caspase family protein [Geminicoccaceae bacterium]
MRRRSSSIRVRRPLPMLPPCSALARRGSRLAGCLVLATALLGSVSPTALAAGRHALLIGNSAYSALPPLDNPSLDARLLAKTLGELGFAVSAVTDADYDGMRAAIDAFRREARDAEVALVYYAGHGVQVDGVNYLLPVDAVVQGRDDLRRQGLVLALLLHEIEALAPEFGILVLDACRNNPVAELEAELA